MKESKAKDKTAYRFGDCIVIGAGASGLFFAAAMTSTKGEFHGIILEGTSRVGTKLLMSGGGHCNITHDGDIKDFIPCYGANGKLIRKILYRHSNTKLIAYLAECGIPTITEDGRVFPASKSSKDVLSLLKTKAEDKGFLIAKDSKVVRIGQAPNPDNQQETVWEIECKSKFGDSSLYMTPNLVVATGGLSYPETGSDGTMLQILQDNLAMEIVTPRPALSPIIPKDFPYAQLSGMSLNARIKSKNRKTSEGALLLTHHGFSGPAAINMSRELEEGDIISINYVHPLTREDAFDKIRDASQGSKAQLGTLLSELFDLPKNFCKSIAERSQGSIKKAASLLTEEQFTVKDCGNFKNAMVTKGGIALNQIDLTTMEANNHPGLYIIGEALDVDGITGGYNLQFAYSSACTAAEAIGKKID